MTTNLLMCKEPNSATFSELSLINKANPVVLQTVA
jgi:hypothetical protein